MCHPKNCSQANRDRALFDEIAQSYEEKDLRLSSRGARAHRLRQTVSDFEAVISQQRLLEVGCGAGFSVDYLNGAYADYLGVDHSAELINRAASRFPDAQFVCCDSKDLNTGDGFDGIFMVGVLHHMESPVDQLKVLHGLLKEGGWIAVNEPNSANPIIQFLRWIRTGSDEGYSEEQRTYSSAQLESEFSAAGFVRVSTKAQGVFSTPFAEVPLRPDSFWSLVARIAVCFDGLLEKVSPRLLRCLSWNLVATAYKLPKE